MRELVKVMEDLFYEMQLCTIDELLKFKAEWIKELEKRNQRTDIIQFCNKITDLVINVQLMRESVSNFQDKEVRNEIS